MKRFLLHRCAKMPARINMARMTKVLAVSNPPPCEKDIDNVLDISGRQIGVTTELAANMTKPPHEVTKSYFIVAGKFLLIIKSFDNFNRN